MSSVSSVRQIFFIMGWTANGRSVVILLLNTKSKFNDPVMNYNKKHV